MSTTNRTVRLTEAQIHEHIANGLENVKHLCQIYDDGHPYICFTMATEVQRAVGGQGYIARMRGRRKFTTPERVNNPLDLTVDIKLIFAEVGGLPPILDFKPAFQGGCSQTKTLNFRDWWNRDVIYRASAAMPGTPPDLIPLRPQDQVPYEKRQTLVRRTFVKDMRNKLGAHLNEEIPESLDNLQRSHSFGMAFAVETESGVLRTADGTLDVRTGPAAAMMRQISQEILVAYRLA